jgi:hypothetical protein
MEKRAKIALAALLVVLAMAVWPASSPPPARLERFFGLDDAAVPVAVAVAPSELDGAPRAIDLAPPRAVEDLSRSKKPHGARARETHPGPPGPLEPPPTTDVEPPVGPELPSPDGEAGAPELAWLPPPPLPDFDDQGPAPTAPPERLYDQEQAEEALRAPLRQRDNDRGVALPAAGLVASALLESTRRHAPPGSAAIFVATIDGSGKLVGIVLGGVRAGSASGWEAAGRDAEAGLAGTSFALRQEYANGAVVRLELTNGEVRVAAEEPPERGKWPWLPRPAPRLRPKEEGEDAVPLEADHRCMGRLLPAGARGTAGVSIVGLVGKIIGVDLEHFDVAPAAGTAHVHYTVEPIPPRFARPLGAPRG